MNVSASKIGHQQQSFLLAVMPDMLKLWNADITLRCVCSLSETWRHPTKLDEGIGPRRFFYIMSIQAIELPLQLVQILKR